MYLAKNDKLWIAIQEIADSYGLEIYDLDRQGSVKLTVIISKGCQRLLEPSTERILANAQGGVTSDDCSQLVRELMVYFQANAERFSLNAEPQIEVCSPGVNRALRLPEHFNGAVGERVKVVFKEPRQYPDLVAPIGSCTGTLKAFDGDELVVCDEGSKEQLERAIKLKDLKKARVEFNFDN